MEAEEYNPPDAANNICPPSPVPPAGDGPITNVFSLNDVFDSIVPILMLPLLPEIVPPPDPNLIEATPWSCWPYIPI